MRYQVNGKPAPKPAISHLPKGVEKQVSAGMQCSDKTQHF
jgi:hypothetical protein